MKSHDSSPTARALKREALALIQQDRSGMLGARGVCALTGWRAQSPAHEQAFLDALRFLHVLRATAQAEPAAPSPLTQSGQRRARTTQVRASAPGASGLRAPAIGRRAFLGGALAASAAYVAVHPPAHLWPSIAELSADYRTGTGERRQVAVNGHVSLDLNTQTSVAVARAGGAKVELISGELAASVTPGLVTPFVLSAGNGRILTSGARIDVRHDKASVCVTCLEGDARVEHHQRAIALSAGQQVVYSRTGIGPPSAADSAASAWRRGVLVFRDAPLREVLGEINRYRRGRLILANTALAERPVLGVFEIAHIDTVVGQVRQLSGARVTQLPGGVVVFS
jgi:transmembrane sensor